MPRPLISIVIANYNYGRFLEAAIESVLSQNMGDQVEVIICDAASTDNSVEIIKRYAGGLPPNTERSDPSILHLHLPPTPITWWCSEPDGGQSAAFNKGFSHAHGKYLTWLNADDVLMPGALMAVAREIGRFPRCEWFVGSSVWADSSLRINRCFCAHRFSGMRARWGFLSAGGPSSFFTKRILDAVGGVDEQLHYMMDTDLWYRFYYQLGVKYRRTIRPVWCFRVHADSKMSGGDLGPTDKSIVNRKNADAEAKILTSRYGARNGVMERLITALSFSPIDYLVSRYFAWKLIKKEGNVIRR